MLISQQVTASLPSILHTHMGHYLSPLLRYCAYFSVTSLQMLPWSCYTSSSLFGGAGGKSSRFLVVVI